MHDLSPGQEVTVSPNGWTAEVLYMRGLSVRVRMTLTGKERTVDITRVTPKRESKALSVGTMEPRNHGDNHGENRAERLPSPLRPVPKPVTLYYDPFLAYVRRHPCLACGASMSEAHHWSHHGASTGKKVDDYRTVPLCRLHHAHWHDHGMLPGMDRVGSEALFLRFQREAIADWTAKRVSDGDMVDALIRVIGGAT